VWKSNGQSIPTRYSTCIHFFHHFYNSTLDTHYKALCWRVTTEGRPLGSSSSSIRPPYCVIILLLRHLCVLYIIIWLKNHECYNHRKVNQAISNFFLSRLHRKFSFRWLLKRWRATLFWPVGGKPRIPIMPCGKMEISKSAGW